MVDPAGLEPASWRLTVDVDLPAFAVNWGAVATSGGETRSLSYVSAAGLEPASPLAASLGRFTRRTFGW